MNDSGAGRGVVGFTAMENGTADDYRLLDRYEREHAEGLADRVLDTLVRLDDSLAGYRITRLEHSLQTATRARQAGADVDWVVAALVHDVGDHLAPFNHDEFAAAMLRPYVREEVTWVVRHHGLFQRYHYAHHLGGRPRRAGPLRRPPVVRPVCSILWRMGPVFVRSRPSDGHPGDVRRRRACRVRT